MKAKDLEEKKLVFGPMTYIYWEYKDLIITAFNNTSLTFHLSNNGGMDGIIFPKLTNIDVSEVIDGVRMVIDLMDQSAQTYQGAQSEFMGFFLLQMHYGENPVEKIENLSSRNITVEHIGETKTAGISFYKYQIKIRKG
jgi:hypothetical protein